VLLAGICLLLAAGAVIIMDRTLQPPRYLPEVPIQQDQSAAGSKAVSTSKQDDPVDFSESFDPSRMTGRQAPDFTLPGIDDGKPVSLQSFRGQPLVLVFGSYECDVFCHEAQRVEQLYQRYRDRAAFLFVYIVPASHAERPLPAALNSPDSAGTNRQARARGAMRALGLSMPGVLDSEDRATQNAYDATPKRMVLVNARGIIEADSARGMPYGWRIKAFEEELKKHVSAPGM
jgi:hypothetical protein